MGIPQEVLNCIFQVCCPEDRAIRALAKMLVDAGKCDHTTAMAVSEYINEYADLMPKGSTVQLKADIARLARG